VTNRSHPLGHRRLRSQRRLGAVVAVLAEALPLLAAAPGPGGKAARCLRDCEAPNGARSRWLALARKLKKILKNKYLEMSYGRRPPAWQDGHPPPPAALTFRGSGGEGERRDGVEGLSPRPDEGYLPALPIPAIVQVAFAPGVDAICVLGHVSFRLRFGDDRWIRFRKCHLFEPTPPNDIKIFPRPLESILCELLF
jgi:hypothetical protein